MYYKGTGRTKSTDAGTRRRATYSGRLALRVVPPIFYGTTARGRHRSLLSATGGRHQIPAHVAVGWRHRPRLAGAGRGAGFGGRVRVGGPRPTTARRRFRLADTRWRHRAVFVNAGPGATLVRITLKRTARVEAEASEY